MQNSYWIVNLYYHEKQISQFEYSAYVQFL